METGLKTQQEKCTIIGLHLKVSLRGTGVSWEGDYDEEELEGGLRGRGVSVHGRRDYEEEECVGGGNYDKEALKGCVPVSYTHLTLPTSVAV